MKDLSILHGLTFGQLAQLLNIPYECYDIILLPEFVVENNLNIVHHE